MHMYTKNRRRTDRQKNGTDHVDEVLVVRDDHELEVLLLAPLRDQPRDGPRQPTLMVFVCIGGVGEICWAQCVRAHVRG